MTTRQPAILENQLRAITPELMAGSTLNFNHRSIYLLGIFYGFFTRGEHYGPGHFIPGKVWGIGRDLDAVLPFTCYSYWFSCYFDQREKIMQALSLSYSYSAFTRLCHLYIVSILLITLSPVFLTLTILLFMILRKSRFYLCGPKHFLGLNCLVVEKLLAFLIFCFFVAQSSLMVAWVSNSHYSILILISHGGHMIFLALIFTKRPSGRLAALILEIEYFWLYSSSKTCIIGYF
jgi:hypothetical protein